MRQLCVQTVCVCKGKGKVQDQAKVKATKTLAKAREARGGVAAPEALTTRTTPTC